jgi:hypothetical protein
VEEVLTPRYVGPPAWIEKRQTSSQRTSLDQPLDLQRLSAVGDLDLLHHLLEHGYVARCDSAGRTVITLAVDDWLLERLLTFRRRR